MYQYSFQHMQEWMAQVIRQNISSAGWEWLQDKALKTSSIQTAFVATPRKTGRTPLAISQKQLNDLQSIRPGFSVMGWPADRLARVWLLLQLDSKNKSQYFESVEKLFLHAEVNELIALYSALPLLAYPEMWSARCAEGIRNNISDVLTAIMCRNPYPAEQLGEEAWNQMVLKAIFTEKPIEEIWRIDDRANASLAKTLSDYAHERWAAHRAVDPQLWRCTGKFLDEALFRDIERIAASPDPKENEAAALACADSDFPPATELLRNNFQLYHAISSGTLTWNSLAAKIHEHVLQQ